MKSRVSKGQTICYSANERYALVGVVYTMSVWDLFAQLHTHHFLLLKLCLLDSMQECLYTMSIFIIDRVDYDTHLYESTISVNSHTIENMDGRNPQLYIIDARIHESFNRSLKPPKREGKKMVCLKLISTPSPGNPSISKSHAK